MPLAFFMLASLFGSTSLQAHRAVLESGPLRSGDSGMLWTADRGGWLGAYELNGGHITVFGLNEDEQALYYGDFLPCAGGEFEQLETDPLVYFIRSDEGVHRIYLQCTDVPEGVMISFIDRFMERLLYYYRQVSNRGFLYPFPAILEFE